MLKQIQLLKQILFACLLLLTAIACVDEEPKSKTEQENQPTDAQVDFTQDADISLPIFDQIIPDALVLDSAIDAQVDQMLGCQTPEDCDGFPCENGTCQYECNGNNDCRRLQVCYEHQCLDRCFGPGTCFNGGVCVFGKCVPEECAQDSDCPEAKLCRGQLCVDPKPCMTNEECASGSRCLNGNCEILSECGGDANCAPDEICNQGKCEQRQDCSTDPSLCMDGEICIAGRCVPDVCRGADDCANNERCQAGVCEAIPTDIMLERVVILNRPQTLTVGQSLQLRAVGLDAQGEIVISEGFSWSVSDANLASVSLGGLLSSGPNIGTVEVVAFWERNGQSIESAPLTLQVIALPEPLADGWRIRLTDQSDGLPITNAQVYVGQQVYEPDLEGVVYIDASANVQAPITFSVMAIGYDSVTIAGISRRELHVPMSPLSDDSVVAGFTGNFDFSQIQNRGEVEVGLAGAAFMGGISQISLFDILGNFFATRVNVGPIDATLPLPGGLTLKADVPFLGPVTIKDSYSVIAHSGFQLGWGFGGKIAINTVLGLVQNNGGLNLGGVLSTILPFFDQFNHGTRAIANLEARPPVADVDDIDRDGNRRELIPDFSQFPQVNITPTQVQNLRLAVQVPNPYEAQDGTPVNIVLSGVEIVDVGFIPLGLTATQEASVLPMRMTPPYQGLQAGDYIVLALSARFVNNIPRNLSGLVYRSRQLPVQVNLGNAFMPIPDSSTWEPATRRVNGGFSEDADLLRVSFRGGVGRWVVYVSKDYQGPVRLPFPTNPEETPDLTVGLDVRFDLLNLTDGLTWDEIIGEGGQTDLDHLDEHVVGFSRFVDNGGR